MKLYYICTSKGVQVFTSEKDAKERFSNLQGRGIEVTLETSVFVLPKSRRPLASVKVNEP